MRTWFAVSALTALGALLFHCGGSDDSAGPSSANDGGSQEASNVGDGGGGGDGAAGSVDVNGTVYETDLTNGLIPAPNVPLTVVGADGVAHDLTTDSSGKFSAPKTATPYGVGVAGAFPDGGAFTNVFYDGLTRPDPSIQANIYVGTEPAALPDQQGTYSFTTNQPANYKIYVSAAGVQLGAAFTGTGGNKVYSGTAEWSSVSTTRLADVHFLVVDTDGNYISQTTDPGVTFSTTGVSLGTFTDFLPVTTISVTPVVGTIPSGQTLPAVSASAVWRDQASGVTFSGPVLSGLKVAADPNFLVDFEAYASGTSGTVGYAATLHPLALPSPVNLPLPTAVTISAPAAGATGINGSTTLTWSRSNVPAVQSILFSGIEDGVQKLRVWTDASSFAMSKLDTARVPLAAATKIQWVVSTATNDALDDANIDHYASPPPAAPNYLLDGGVLGIAASSSVEFFTTQ